MVPTAPLAKTAATVGCCSATAAEAATLVIPMDQYKSARAEAEHIAALLP